MEVTIGELSLDSNQICEGVHVFGGTGSGKTSGPLQKIRDKAAKEIHEGKLGALVLCAKSDEAQEWLHDTYKEKITPRYMSRESFNFLEWEASRGGGGHTENIIDIIMTVVEVMNRKTSSGGSDEYWVNAMKQMLRNAIDLLKETDERVTILNIKKVIDTSPRKDGVIEGNNYCSTLLGRLGKSNTAEMVKLYFVSEFMNMGDKQRGGIISTFTSIADPLCRGVLSEKLSEKTTWKPEDLERGEILFVDYSVKKDKAIGTIMAAVIKYCVQLYIESRNNKEKPIMIYADEAQFFVNKKDIDFQTTARSNKGITVYATQNINSYYEVIGERSTKSLLGNLRSLIFCANTCKETNDFASDMIGNHIVLRSSGGESHSSSQGKNTGQNKASIFDGGNSSNSIGANIGSSESASSNWSEQREKVIESHEFRQLKTGGEGNNYAVEFIAVSPSIKPEGWLKSSSFQTFKGAKVDVTKIKEVNEVLNDPRFRVSSDCDTSTKRKKFEWNVSTLNQGLLTLGIILSGIGLIYVFDKTLYEKIIEIYYKFGDEYYRYFDRTFLVKSRPIVDGYNTLFNIIELCMRIFVPCLLVYFIFKPYRATKFILTIWLVQLKFLVAIIFGALFTALSDKDKK